MVVRVLMVTLVMVSAVRGQHQLSSEELRRITQLLGTSPPLRIGKAISHGTFSDEVDSRHVNVPLEKFGVRYNGNSPSLAKRVGVEDSQVFEFNFGRGAINGPVVSSRGGKSIIASLGRGSDHGPVVSTHSKKQSFKNARFHGKSRKTSAQNLKVKPGKLTFGFTPIHAPRNVIRAGNSFSFAKEPSVKHQQHENEVFTRNNDSVFLATVTDDDAEKTSDDGDSDKEEGVLYRHQLDKVLVSNVNSGPGTAAGFDLLESINAPVDAAVPIDSPVNDLNVINDQSSAFSQNFASFSNNRQTRSHPINHPRKQLLSAIRQKIITGSEVDRPSNNNQRDQFSSQQNTFSGSSGVSQGSISLGSPSIVRGLPFRIISDRPTSTSFVNFNGPQHMTSHNEGVSNHQNFNNNQVRLTTGGNRHTSFTPTKDSSVKVNSHADNQQDFSQAREIVRNFASSQGFTSVQSQNGQSQFQSQGQNSVSRPTSAPVRPTILTRRPTTVQKPSSIQTQAPIHTSRFRSTTHKQNTKPTSFIKSVTSTKNSSSKKIKMRPLTVKRTKPTKPTHAIQPRHKNSSSKTTSRPVQIVQTQQKTAAPTVTAVKTPSVSGSPLPASVLQSLRGSLGPSITSAGAGGSQIIVKTIELDASDADPSSEAFRAALAKATKEARLELGVADDEELGVGGAELAKLFGRRRRRSVEGETAGEETFEGEVLKRQKRQFFGGGDQSTAQSLGGALSTGAGLLGALIN